MEQERLVEQVRVNPVFGHSTTAALVSLLTDAETIDLDADETFLHAGEASGTVDLVLWGKVKVYNPQTMAIARRLVAPTVVGDLEALIGEPYMHSAAALVRTRVVRVHTHRFREYVRHQPQSSYRLLLHTYGQLHAQDRAAAHPPVGLASRLAETLLDYGEEYGILTEAGLQIFYSLGEDTLARELGESTGAVAGVLAEWRSCGWLAHHKGWTVLRDPEALQELARPAPPVDTPVRLPQATPSQMPPVANSDDTVAEPMRMRA